MVIALNDLGQDDRTKNMLVAIMLNVFYERMLKVPKRPFLGMNGDMRVVDSMLLVDEADNIMQYEFDVLRKVLLQGREFGMGVILASQYLSHFKAGATDYREMLLTWFLHKVPNLSGKDLGPLGLSDPAALQQAAERIKALGLHECLYKTHDVAGEFIRGHHSTNCRRLPHEYIRQYDGRFPFSQRALEQDVPDPREGHPARAGTEEALHRLGLRFRLHGAGLPGKPDLVFPRYKTVVFVHGCFWHQHAGCSIATIPKSNTQFWVEIQEKY